MNARRFWSHLGVLVVALVLSQGGTYLLLLATGAARQPYAGLIINTVFLLACLVCIRLFSMSSQDIGLKILPPRLTIHVSLCLAIFFGYFLYYLFAVRISNLRPITSATLWGLLNYLVVSFSEETYSRGILYHLLEQRYSGRTAVLLSALFFALLHLRQGPPALLRFPTGVLWGSVRYSTGMIFLLVFPVHFAYNATWLLFRGNWDSPPGWALLIPLLELLIGFLIVRRSPILPPNP